MSRSKARDIRAGMPELVYLVPELCRQTGLSDEQRANMTLMRAMAGHTKLGPSERIKKLMEFNRKLTTVPLVAQVNSFNYSYTNNSSKNL